MANIGYTEPPCDPPEVSRAFQEAEMSKDPTRKYECKFHYLQSDFKRFFSFFLCADLDHPADIQYVTRNFTPPVYSKFNSFHTGFTPVSLLLVHSLSVEKSLLVFLNLW